MPPKKNSAATNKQKGESYVKRTSFYTNVEWQPGCKPDQYTFIRGQMYVESLEPQKKTQKWPIVFIHGDFHSSQIWLTKPDGDPGWASFFVGKGFHVYLVDLPGSGKSNTLTKEAITNTEINSIKASQIEREITAPEVFNHISDPRWPTALKHDKWPGTGRRGDRIFDRYCASLTSLLFTIEERQTLAQNALKSLLKITGQAVLVGEGTGATASWLAADVAPQQVAGVVAVEPPGPPFCEGTVERNGKRKFDSFTSFNPDRLKYGLASIPLTFDPSPHPEPDLDQETAGLLPVALTQPDTSSNATPQRLHPLDLALFVEAGSGKRVVLQYSPENIPNGFVFSEKMTSGDGTMCIRKLTNLSKMRHVVITGEASSHSEYDTSTMHFMKQAGLSVDCGFLERYQTRGNGHLMFLETNSDEVATHIMRWIQTRAGKVDEPTNVVDLEEVSTVTPPLNLSPSQNYGVERQPFRSSKRGKWEVIDGPELAMPSTSSPQFIDLTENPYNAISYCANDTPPVASAVGYPSPSVSKTTQTTQNTSLDQGCTLPDVSSAGLSNPVERSPPPLPQRNWRPASMSGQGELMCADAKIEVPEPSPRENKFVMPSVIWSYLKTRSATLPVWVQRGRTSTMARLPWGQNILLGGLLELPYQK
ncbi:lipoprotein [Cordyceps javanica]|uniref:Lipoprotein n=1 Tax=Cordyceps javanica TaxID=43265 RepID=A0A545V3Z6_9HYPO|nr:lipoprotein [Cordyceps javanica]TQW07721.1 alpha/beta hydrolase family [Cordyceps javanica]